MDGENIIVCLYTPNTMSTNKVQETVNITKETSLKNCELGPKKDGENLQMVNIIRFNSKMFQKVANNKRPMFRTSQKAHNNLLF